MEWDPVLKKRFVSIALVGVLWTSPALAETPPSLIHLDFKADVQADGVPANVQPDASLSPPLQEMVRKRVAAWRYRMGTWQGKPVPAKVSQRIVAEVLPVASGGFALRIKDVVAASVILDGTGASTAGRMFPPRYPESAQRQGIEATMIYAMRRDAQGMPLEVELVDAQLPGKWRKPFDAVSRQAIQQWRLAPVRSKGRSSTSGC